MYSKHQLGKLGEDIAASYLTQKGLRIIDRNFKKRYGELDLIGIEEHTLVFVEVKTRSDLSFGLPEEAVTPRKLREVVKTAQFYKSLHDELPKHLRIDVVALVLDKIGSVKYLNYIRNVTQ